MTGKIYIVGIGPGSSEYLTKNWDEFKAILEKRKLSVYESGGWMKIMKA